MCVCVCVGRGGGCIQCRSLKDKEKGDEGEVAEEAHQVEHPGGRLLEYLSRRGKVKCRGGSMG